MNDQELEIKLYINDLHAIEEKLISLGAKREQARVLEINLRFDTPQGDLSRSAKALRLRKDTAARLTYKGPAESVEGVRQRQEIEFVVDDFHAARRFLEALGFGIRLIYEKYRAQYLYQGVHVTLDELPFGNFVEIEGPDPTSIQQVCHQLGLNWGDTIAESYVMLFLRLQQQQGYAVRDLIFDNFCDPEIGNKLLGLQPADR